MLRPTRRAVLGAAVAGAVVLSGTGGIGVLAADGDDIIPGFAEALAAGGPVLIHVTATWCEVCQAQKPIVGTLLAQPDFSTMTMFEVDFDSQKAILRRYQVQQQSTMIIYKGGAEVDRQVGQTDPAVIEAFLREAL